MKRILLLGALCIASLAGAQERPEPILTFEPRADSTVPVVREFAAPPIYFKWWQEIADCEGLDLPLQRVGAIQFFEVLDTTFTPTGGNEDLGATVTEVSQVFLATPQVWNEQTVKHEMLHNILDWAGFDFGVYHPAEFFERCGLVPWGHWKN